MAEPTPMMKQYLEIKAKHPDSILFFRLGDFYEMFDEDAQVASRELDLTLTSRNNGKQSKTREHQTPMCGVPYHSSDSYIARLVAKGYKVAVCEQVEDPSGKKTIVERDIVRVITPGTVMDGACLDERTANFLCSIYLDDAGGGVVFCDISTGKTHLTSFTGETATEHIINELGRFVPAEAVLNKAAFENRLLMDALEEKLNCHLEQGKSGYYDLNRAEKAVRAQFSQDALSKLPSGQPQTILALGGLLGYLHETQRTDLHHINELDYYSQGRFMELDLAARRNLELTETLRSKEKKGSLLWVLDQTRTSMGARCLRGFLDRPLLSAVEIRQRNGAVQELVNSTIPREELIVALKRMGDMERIIGRIVYGTAGGRDMVALRTCIEAVPHILSAVKDFQNPYLKNLCSRIEINRNVHRIITISIVDDPPFSVREGGFICDGYNAEVDRLRDILSGGKNVMREIEQREREKTGIRTLKIGYNKVFGYYIEVSNSFKDQVPDTYIRKQTLVNSERYITQELKDLEHSVLTAGDRLSALEYELFEEVRKEVIADAPEVRETAAAVAELDALTALATVAVNNNYCCPEVDDSGVIEIQEGRHPVVERMLKDTLFVPNDTAMRRQDARVAVITGPNMAGKSTYMRQVALIVLMAQIGSFVPAKSAHIGVVDRIFTRIGASDDLSAGQSTFMVEMTEVSDILHHATSRSLLILDEIGRGTSTFDGMSIARAVLEYCADPKRLGAKTLFATHYHELTDADHALQGTANFNIAVKTRGEDIIFLRKIIPGGADRSYGIEVAKLAGLPEQVVRRARQVLREMESTALKPGAESATRSAKSDKEPEQVNFGNLQESEVLDALRRCQPDTMTPIEALGLLYTLKKKLE